MPRNWLRPRLRAGARGRREPVRDRPQRAGIRAPASHLHAQPEHGADRRSLEPPAHVDQRHDDHRDGARAADGRGRRGSARAVGPRRIDVRGRAGRRARQDRLLGARRRHGDEGRLAQGVRHRRGRRPRRAGARARSPRARRPRPASAATPPRPTATASASRWGRPTTSATSPTSAPGSTGALPSYVNQSAMSMIRTLRGIPAYSKGHWTDGDRIVLLSDTGALNWVQIDGNAHGTLARTGDANKATEPAFSHDGNNVVYVSGTSLIDGRLGNGPADLYCDPVRQPRGRQRDAARGRRGSGRDRVLSVVLARRRAGRVHAHRRQRQLVQQPGVGGVRGRRSPAGPAAPRSGWPPTTRPRARRRSPARA